MKIGLLFFILNIYSLLLLKLFKIKNIVLQTLAWGVRNFDLYIYNIYSEYE